MKPLKIELRSSSPDIAKSWDWQMENQEAIVWADARTGHAYATQSDGTSLGQWDDPLKALDWMGQFNLADTRYSDPRWVGYLSYDLGRWFERLPTRAADDLGLPLYVFVLSGAQSWRSTTGSQIDTGIPSEIHSSTFTKESYLAAVGRAIEYIAAGDVFQVNLSQRFTVRDGRPAAEVFRRLSAAGGAHYGAFMHFGEFSLASNSPELFLNVEPLPDGKRKILTRPIKGTRRRAAGMQEELRISEKDKAELNMIVDLERNDLGRICEIGSVKVSEPRTIEEHPTVYHGVATVEGMLRSDVGLVDLLRATFPGGSITGAPKIRAMEIIEELEPTRRGPYCGAIGWIGPGGRMQFNVAIRTMILKDGLVHIPVGGGIVADSVPELEYEETLVKARAMFDAVGVRRLG